jgi:hypothetical protein
MKVHQPNGNMENVDSRDLSKMTGKTELLSSEQLESMKESLTEAEIYNESLSVIEDEKELAKIELLGNAMLLRPFKLIEETTKSGLTLTEKKQEFLNKSSMKIGYEDLAFPYQTRGVIVKMSADAAEMYNGQIEVGTIVSIPLMSMPSMSNMMFKMNKNKWLPEDDEKYLTLLISGNRIESYEPRT